MRPLATIGYEAATVKRFQETLADAGIELLVDVRALAMSRRPGFAKSALTANLAEVGIDYLHLRRLGTPAEGRAAARAGRHDEMHAIFREQLATEGAQEELHTLADLVRRRKVCIMCFEHDPTHCHRLLVANALGALLPLKVAHLDPSDE